MRMDKQIKRNVFWIHVTTWVNLKAIIVSERIQAQKDISYMSPFIQNSGIRKLIYIYKKQVNGCLEIGVEEGRD